MIFAHYASTSARLFTAVSMVAFLEGCERPSCEDLRRKTLEIVVDNCHGNYEFGDQQCSEAEAEELECKISCFEGASCAAVRDEPGREHDELIACIRYCDFFIVNGHDVSGGSQ